MLNGLRGRIAVQVDGGMRTGRDVVIGALLGADEFGFATAPLIAAGCIMMRKCHLNTCPVGVATQDPVLRKRFDGQPEHVINFFFFVAEEVRELMAALGFRSFNEMIGQSQMLDKAALIEHGKAQGLDFSRLFYKPSPGRATRSITARRRITARQGARPQVSSPRPARRSTTASHVRLDLPIRNSDRSVGAMLSGEIARRYGHDGLPDGTIHIKFTGTAGQSFGAFLAKGVTLELEGDANDYVGKGLSGGRIIVYPPKEAAQLTPEKSIIVGNTVLYGAIAGECYFRGVAGERFAVRNSGADRRGRGRRRSRLRIHDRRRRRGDRRDRPQFRRRHVRRHRLRARRGGDFAERCNLAMVELEPVAAEEEAMQRHHHRAAISQGHGRVDVMGDMTRSTPSGCAS